MAAHKMNDGRWCVWLDLGVDPLSGRRVRRRVEAKTKREAESKATALRDRHRRGENVQDKPRALGELLDDWLSTVARTGRAANTITAYRGAIENQLARRLGAIAVPKLRTRDIQRVFNDMADQLKPTYIRQIKSVLVMALDFAVEQHEITINPAEKVRIPTVKHNAGRSLSAEETRAVLAACEGHRYGLAVRLALLGLRRGEISGLRWEDFNEVAGTLAIQRQFQRIDRRWTAIEPKKGSVRTLTLGTGLTAALRKYRWDQAEERDVMGWADSGYLFISTRNGGLCPPSTIYNAFKDIAKAAGIEPARLHDCRHTAGTTLLSSGEDIATVAGVLGHASPQVTAAVYVHALPHKVANASKRLEDIYGEADLPHQDGKDVL